MEFVIVTGAIVLGIFSWLLWAILVGLVFFAAVGIPWGLWELFMYLTFNNIINLFAKLPSFIGFFFGFVLSLPFAAVSVTVSLWAYFQTFMMACLTFRGETVAEGFIEEFVVPFESHFPKSFVIIRYYYENCKWLWGGAGFEKSYFPWQNGCGNGWGAGDFWWPTCDVPEIFSYIKLLLLALPYLILFVMPLLPLLWSALRPLVGGFAALPSVSGNAGKD